MYLEDNPTSEVDVRASMGFTHHGDYGDSTRRSNWFCLQFRHQNLLKDSAIKDRQVKTFQHSISLLHYAFQYAFFCKTFALITDSLEGSTEINLGYIKHELCYRKFFYSYYTLLLSAFYTTQKALSSLTRSAFRSTESQQTLGGYKSFLLRRIIK